jgi:hypothetical protein
MAGTVRRHGGGSYPDTPAGHARALRDSFGALLTSCGHVMTWQKLKNRNAYSGRCRNCTGKIRVLVTSDGLTEVTYPEPDILRTRIRKAIRDCEGRS